MAEEWTAVGERVRQAREAAGLTQGQLAESVGLERTALVRVESGQRQLNAMELFKLSDTLDVPLAYFVTPPPRAMVSRRQAMHAEPTGADRIRFRLDVALSEHARNTMWLVGHGLLEPPAMGDFDQPRRTTLLVEGEAEAVYVARLARQLLGQPSGPLGPMAEVAERLGAYLTSVDVDADGASVLLEGYSAVVTGAVPDPGRRRWTAAHEIGHHLMQDEYTAEVGGVSASRDEREQLIDAFAGELLLPESDIASRLDGVRPAELRPRLVAVAGEYRVSWSAVVMRARNAGLIDAETAHRLRADTPVRGDLLAVMGREPQPDLEPGDHGPGWKQAVLRAHRQSLITAPRAVELLGGGLTVADLPQHGAS